MKTQRISLVNSDSSICFLETTCSRTQCNPWWPRCSANLAGTDTNCTISSGHLNDDHLSD